MFYGNLPKNIEECKSQLYAELKKRNKVKKKDIEVFVDVFFKTEDHFSRDDFVEILSKNKITLDKNIVGYALHLLVQFGFALDRMFEGEHTKRFEHLHPTRHHDHFICVKCKKIMEFVSPSLEKVQNNFLGEKGWKPLYHKLEIYGICKECDSTRKQVFPVVFAKEGERVFCDSIEGEWKEKKYLIELGFVKGSKIYIVKNSGIGPLILEIKGARIAIGRGKAGKIMVK